MTLSLRGHWLSRDSGRDLIVVGPSLGTAVTPLWRPCTDELVRQAKVDVLGWELPGHGDGPPTDEPFTLADLAEAIVALVDRVRPDTRFHHAGVSVAGATGLELQLGPSRDRLRGSAVVCSGARLGTGQQWAERAELVRAAGTPVMIEGSARRWFAPGFIDRQPDLAGSLLSSLQHTDAASYARVCEALGSFDVRDQLSDLAGPLLVLGGAEDVVAPPEMQRELHAAVPGASLSVLDGVAHLAPVEAPRAVATTLSDWIEETR